MRFLRAMADETDFSGGAYRFRRWHGWPVFATGLYRARAVELRYADGNAVEAPLNDEIVVDVQPPATSDVPVFTAPV
ncbi:MAG: hypothetical protein QOJ39_3420 [Candidatus Eremiobacteraeota bacterium]|nr:hypothetical protein [Candidatus Eremiobacteraeota bacterium]